jgi:isoquinoline 1-oxidoreductase beta subunit
MSIKSNMNTRESSLANARRAPAKAFVLDRRDFLRGGAAGLVVCFTVGVGPRDARAGTGAMLGAYIQIAPAPQDAAANLVTIYAGPSEMGQGILSGLAQLVAEELMLPWNQVQAEPAPVGAAYANPIFHSQLTGGSTSMRGWFTPMRRAAAVAREMLITAGAAVLKQPRNICVAQQGAIWCGSLSIPYNQIVAAAAGVAAPDPMTVPLVSNFKVIGQRVPRVDLPAKVNGSATFGIDVRLPDMVYAAVKHCPTIGGTVASMPAKPSGALGLVNLNNAVAVVATDTWQAMRLADSLQVQWTPPSDPSQVDSASILAIAQSLMASGAPSVMENSNFPDAALVEAVVKLDSTYQLPYVAHGCMEVLSCTAVVTPTSCEIWAPTQGQARCVGTAQSLLGLQPSQITVHTTLLGGGLGRKIEQDFIAQAILIAKAIGKPVKLTWSRKQDFQNDRYRPCALIRVRAGLDRNGAFSTLIHRTVAPSINAQRGGSAASDAGAVEGATHLPYAIANRRIEFVPHPAAIPVGFWRSVGNSCNTFAIESALDELAAAAGKDPLAFRQGLLTGDPRGTAIVNAVLAWHTKNTLRAGSARGLAFSTGFGSYAALLVELSLKSDGTLKVNQVFCAIDCGLAVNPDSVEAQMQSGIVHGLNATLWGQVQFNQGMPDVTNFSNNRVMRLSEMPAVTVQIINSGGPIGGIGETAVPCVAPAVANAYFRLTGTRVRKLPFYPGAKMGGL